MQPSCGKSLYQEATAVRRLVMVSRSNLRRIQPLR